MSKDLVAYCGLYCGACSFRLAALERDAAHLSGLPDRYQRAKDTPIEEFELCPGCRQTDDPGYCKMKDCVKARGYETCADCPELPCDNVKAFCADGVPHHNTLPNLLRIRETGTEAWAEEQRQLHTTPCGKAKSWYQE